MKKKLTFKNYSIYFDQYLFISITLLSVMGLFFLYSASQGDLNTVIKQSIFVGFGLFLMFVSKSSVFLRFLKVQNGLESSRMLRGIISTFLSSVTSYDPKP